MDDNINDEVNEILRSANLTNSIEANMIHGRMAASFYLGCIAMLQGVAATQPQVVAEYSAEFLAMRFTEKYIAEFLILENANDNA